MSVNNENGWAGIAAVLVVLLIAPALTAWYVYGTQRERTFTVNKSERVTTGSGENISSKYLLFTDQGVFENTDTFLRWKFNSSDLYAQIKENKTYNCDTFGWRLQFFSQYPNVVSCKEVI